MHHYKTLTLFFSNSNINVIFRETSFFSIEHFFGDIELADNGVNWINYIHLQRIAQKSCIVIVETSDWKRVEQLKNAIPRLQFFKGSTVYVYNAGIGLFKLENSNGETRQVKVELGDDLYGGDNTVMGVIENLEDELKEKPTTLIIEAMPEDIDEKIMNLATRKLNTKLLAMTRYPQLYKAKSTIIIVSPNPEAIFSKNLLSEVIYEKAPIPNMEERKQIIAKSIEKIKQTVKQKNRGDWLKTIQQFEKQIDSLAMLTAGLTVKQIEDLIPTAIYYKVANIIKNPQAYIMTEKDKMVEKTSGGILKIEVPRYGFEAIGGMNALKHYITQNMVNILKNMEKAEKMGVELPRGIILFGPPGTGKTVFAKALGKEVGLIFITRRPNLVYQKWVGSSEARIRKAIDTIEQISPAIVYIDEIDRLGRRTDTTTDSGVSRRVFSTILEWLGREDRKAIIVGSTNTIEHMDPAFLRAGRISLIAPVLYPDLQARIEILRIHTTVKRKLPLADNIDYGEIAMETKLWTGAELEELVKRATRIAFNENSDKITQEHMIQALETMTINTEQRQQQLQQYLQQAKQYTNDTTLLQQLQKETQNI